MKKPLPSFLPVIHVASASQALEQTSLAFAHGADGVFLIDHRRRHPHLIRTYLQVRQEFPDRWIGLNLLDLPAREAMSGSARPSRRRSRTPNNR